MENVKEKIEMNTDDFLESLAAMDEYPETLHDYGITMEDIKRMESDPPKYIRFAMYLLSRDYDDDHIFINADALPVKDASFWLNEFINANVQLTD